MKTEKGVFLQLCIPALNNKIKCILFSDLRTDSDGLSQLLEACLAMERITKTA